MSFSRPRNRSPTLSSTPARRRRAFGCIWTRCFTLEIEDNGRGPAGLTGPAAQTRNGLRNMRKRMEDIGGKFEVGPEAPKAALSSALSRPRNKLAMPITVSIVEDNDQLRATLARLLNRSEGFQCLSHYGDAESALAALPGERPEVVLVDINLPGMNGVEFVGR